MADPTPEATLLPLLTTRCFWWPRCAHVVTDVDPTASHDAMERHYGKAHQDDLRKIVGWVR